MRPGFEGGHIIIWTKKLTRNRGDTSDTAFESPRSTLFNYEKILTIRTHPEELHGLKVGIYQYSEMHFGPFSRPRSSSR